MSFQSILVRLARVAVDARENIAMLRNTELAEEPLEDVSCRIATYPI